MAAVQTESIFVSTENTDRLELKKLDLQSGLSLKLAKPITLTLGCVIRVREPAYGKGAEFRLIQMFTHAFKKSEFKWKNQLRLEQRQDQANQESRYDFALRIRYKLLVGIPLGKHIFTNAGTEFLFTPTLSESFQKLGNRYFAGIGYQLNKATIISLGYELRIKNVLTPYHEETGLIKIAAQYKG